MSKRLNTTVVLEACVDSVESALAAEQGGADRIELCADLLEGGLTPSAGTLGLCRRLLKIPIYVMIRPRGGDFLYSNSEFETMAGDIAYAKRRGADGVVLGLLDRNGRVDVPRTRALVRLARPLDVTFHRAIDVARDAEAALDAIIAAGADRVLTSGQAPTAAGGTALIARLVERAAGRIVILAGGGIDERNVRRVVEKTGVGEVHVRGTTGVTSKMKHKSRRVRFGPDDYHFDVTDARRIKRMVQILKRR